MRRLMGSSLFDVHGPKSYKYLVIAPQSISWACQAARGRLRSKHNRSNPGLRMELAGLGPNLF